MTHFQIKHHINQGQSTSFSQKIVNIFQNRVKRQPFLFFGLPFITVVVGASFFMTNFTQNRYDYQSKRLKTLDKNERLKLKEDRRKLDLQEEYWRLMQERDKLESWENKRVPREEEN